MVPEPGIQDTKKIKDITKQLVTFYDKRRALFKEASTLCQTCDAEVAIITISAAGMIKAFGHPSADSVFRRYKAHKSSSDQREEGNNDEQEQHLPEKDETEQSPADYQNKHSQIDLNLPLPLDDPNVDSVVQGHKSLKSSPLIQRHKVCRYSFDQRYEGNTDEQEEHLPENVETGESPADDQIEYSQMDLDSNLALSLSMNYQEQDDSSCKEKSEKSLSFPRRSQDKNQETGKKVAEIKKNIVVRGNQIKRSRC